MVEPLNNCQAKTIADSRENINQKFVTSGVQPHTYVLDNELSKTLKKAFEKYTINFQLVPPHSHQSNKAERVIRTFKDHFKAVLATFNPEVPIAHWGLLITQSVMTLNMLRVSQLNPKTVISTLLP